MQSFIAYGRVADIPADAVGKTSNGHVSFKFQFVCDSSFMENGKPIPSFFHVQVYGRQAEVMIQSLSKGSPILIKGEMIQRPYINNEGQRRTYLYIAPNQQGGITFLESKEASNKRKQGQMLSSPLPSQSDSYPEPLDAGEPF